MHEDKETLVTAYYEPDLDGYACVYAYTEYLNKSGKKAIHAVFGKPQSEVTFVLKKFEIDPIGEYTGDLNRNIIIVDASDIQGIYQAIKPENVAEIIDHRIQNSAGLFPNAVAQIEFVGSAATLITEKFIDSNLEISKNAAILLYSAIISNTLNFQARVTTQRDKAAADWLNATLGLKDKYAWEMFEDKSKSIFNDLENSMDQVFAGFQFNKIHLGIVQLEVINAKKLLTERKSDIISILRKMQKVRNIDNIFLTITELKEGYNLILCEDRSLQRSLSAVLGINFEGDTAQRDGLMMRKEMVPILKEYFVTNS